MKDRVTQLRDHKAKCLEYIIMAQVRQSETIYFHNNTINSD